MFNRNNPFSIEIKDPNNPDDVDPVNSLIVVNDQCFAIRENSVYRILTAETIDPEAKHPDTKHSYEKVYPIGSSSPFLARVTIQFNEIIKFISLPKKEHEKFILYLWQANKYLINAHIVEALILRKATELLVVCDNVIEENKTKPTIPALPQITDLEENVRIFFNNAKLFLIESFRLLNIFYQMPFGGRVVAHFDVHYEWAEKKLGGNHQITKMLSTDLPWIRHISECRNALEHPEEGQEINLRNFSILPGNKFTSPCWSYDLSKKLKLKQDFTDLCNDLCVFSDNMLHFFEDLLLLCVNEKLEKTKMLVLAQIQDNKLDSKCPIKYSVTLKEEFIKNNITT
jgi:hypothetical protein